MPKRTSKSRPLLRPRGAKPTITPKPGPPTPHFADEAIRLAHVEGGWNRGASMRLIDAARLRLAAAQCWAWAADPEDWTADDNNVLTAIIGGALHSLMQGMRGFAVPADQQATTPPIVTKAG